MERAPCLSLLKPNFDRELERSRSTLLIARADRVVRAIEHSGGLAELPIGKVRIDVSEIGMVE